MTSTMRVLSAAAMALVFSCAARAEPVGIGTLPQGSLGYSVASSIAKVVTQNAGIEARAVGTGGSNVYIPQVNGGEMEMGTSNTIEAVYAFTGTGNFKSNTNPDIRIVAALMPFQVGLMVRDSSTVKKIKDLKGKPFATDYTSQKLVQVFLEAVLAAEGMTIADLRRVPAANFVKGAEMTAAGRVEGVLLAPGSGVVAKTNAKEPIRFLSIEAGAEGEKMMQEAAPGSYLTTVEPRKNLPGIVGPTTLMGYEYVLLGSGRLADDMAYRTAKAIHENKDGLVASHGIWRRFDPSKMAVDSKVPYHPGAIRYYREAGLWKK